MYLLNKPRKTPTPRTYEVYQIYDRDEADEEWYWVKWFGFKDEVHDTAQHRSNLVRDGFEQHCDYVDDFKVWQAQGEDGEVRTFPAFLKHQKVFICSLLFCSCVKLTQNICLASARVHCG